MTLRRLFAALTVPAILAVVSMAAAGAAPKHGGSGGSSPTFAVAPSSDLRLGGAVSFVYSTTASAPRVEIDCYQPTDASGLASFVPGHGYFVYAEARAASDSFTLGGSMSAWTMNGGSASCVAQLYYWDF